MDQPLSGPLGGRAGIKGIQGSLARSIVSRYMFWRQRKQRGAYEIEGDAMAEVYAAASHRARKQSIGIWNKADLEGNAQMDTEKRSITDRRTENDRRSKLNSNNVALA